MQKIIPKEIVDKLKKEKIKRVFVQFPEGLKLKIQDIAKELEEQGFEVVLSFERTFGACDVREYEASLLKCDGILHIAHADFGIKTKLPVVYWDYFIEADAVPILKKEFEKLKNFRNIGLVTSLQFVQTLPSVKEFLEKNGKNVFIHKSQQYLGQMLGCRIGAGKAIEKDVDCFLCISAGKFYGLGLALNTDKPMLNLDLEKSSIYEIEDVKRKIMKITAWNKQKLKDAKRVGFLISWKRGQMFGNPFKDKEKLEKEGKEVFLLAMDEITKDKLEGLKVDIFINYSCPRLGVDDLERFGIPILNWFQINSR